MTRVSLREAYDNKDVVAQIYAIRDTAESAVDTSEQAVTTANTASEHVDALVPEVEQAVENANSASASAQASAQTVAGYENRLATAESDIDGLESDLNAVTLRVTTAEGDIVTIQGRVTAIEGNYLKKSGDPQTVVSQINVPTTTTGARDTQIANGTRIQNDLDNYTPMVRTSGNQTISGFKYFTNRIRTDRGVGMEETSSLVQTDLHYSNLVSLFGDENIQLGRLEFFSVGDGKQGLRVVLRNQDGTSKYIILGMSD